MTFRRHYLWLVPVLALSACKGNSGDATGDSKQAEAPAAQQEVANPVDPATAATISGTVKFTGAKPKATKINMGADAFCKTAHTEAVFAPDVVVNANNTLKWAYVYVKSGLKPDMKFPAPAEAVTLDQNGCMYSPHVVGVMTNQQLKVKNSDSVLHNVNVRPTKNPGFNIGQPVKGMESPKSFANAELMIPVKCDVHPWMNAYIAVSDHPYFAVTGEDGSFTLPNLPPGEYEIAVWHEKLGETTQKVTVGASEKKTVDLALKGA